MVHKTLSLDHDLNPGWLAPWVDAVMQAQALARRCVSCGRISFVPLRHCDCGESQGSWITLPGSASLVERTSGREGDFALVQFEGADTQSVVRLVNWSDGATHGHMLAPDGELPALLLGPLGSHTSRNEEDQ